MSPGYVCIGNFRCSERAHWWLTWSTLKHYQKEIDCREQDSAGHEELNGPDVPALDCNSEVEVAD